METPPQENLFIKYAVLIKSAIVVFLTLFLLIPTGFIQDLVREREFRKNDATSEITNKWGGAQTLGGPSISIPAKANSSSPTVLYVLPEKLSINGEVFPEKRYRSLYEVVVYNSKIVIEGSFGKFDLAVANLRLEDLDLSAATFGIGISDLRGIEELIELDWNGVKTQFSPSSNNLRGESSEGISAPVKFDLVTGEYKFRFELILKGSSNVMFTPVGKETLVKIKSTWQTPSFDGAFLPDNRNVSSSGFEADWKILHLNRPFSQQFLGGNYAVGKSVFGVNLLLPADHYSKTQRTVKYAILLIGLTFLIFFFLELLNNKKIHPFQYILVGFALVIFYILLLSISEHINFNYAYVIATTMTTALVTLYMRSVFGDSRLSLLTGSVLLMLYGFVFILVQLFDYSLLMGSIGLFVILALVMYFSRKIDWQKV